MSLDIYVGTLTRYYCGEWETESEATARAAGRPGRPAMPRDAMSSPREVRPVVEKWRRRLSRSIAAAGVMTSPLMWSEHDDEPWFTAKPAWDCWGALELLAAYEEAGTSPPRLLDERWEDDACLAAVTGEDADPRYAHLYQCEWWLPGEFDAVFSGPTVGGRVAPMGSSAGLLEQMRELNTRTFAAGDAEMATWLKAGGGEGDELEPKARYGLALVTLLVERADRHGLPMLLDY